MQSDLSGLLRKGGGGGGGQGKLKKFADNPGTFVQMRQRKGMQKYSTSFERGPKLYRSVHSNVGYSPVLATECERTSARPYVC